MSVKVNNVPIKLNMRDAVISFNETLDIDRRTLYIVVVQEANLENGIWQFETFNEHLARHMFNNVIINESVSGRELQKKGFKFF